MSTDKTIIRIFTQLLDTIYCIAKSFKIKQGAKLVKLYYTISPNTLKMALLGLSHI